MNYLNNLTPKKLRQVKKYLKGRLLLYIHMNIDKEIDKIFDDFNDEYLHKSTILSTVFTLGIPAFEIIAALNVIKEERRKKKNDKRCKRG